MNKLSNLYKDISIDTWNRLEFTSKTKSKFSETTITENLLYTIDKYRIENKDDSIQMYESKNESANGNDLEVYLELEDNKYIFLAIQAKRLYTESQKYTAISHKVGSNYQIDLLLNYAKIKNGIPLYLLYNYSATFKNKNKKLYGCSITKANYVYNNFYPKSSKRWRIPTFNDLHTNNAIPLFILGKNKCFKNFISSYSKKLKLYESNEIVDNTWVQIEKLKAETDERKEYIFEDKNYNKNLIIEPEIEKVFTPKFKIVIKKRDNKTSYNNK